MCTHPIQRSSSSSSGRAVAVAVAVIAAVVPLHVCALCSMLYTIAYRANKLYYKNF